MGKCYPIFRDSGIINSWRAQLLGGAAGGAASSAYDNPNGISPTLSGVLAGAGTGILTGTYAAPGIAIATLGGASEFATALIGAMGSIQGDTIDATAIAIYKQQQNQSLQPQLCP
jgi:hypothetical protein